MIEPDPLHTWARLVGIAVALAALLATGAVLIASLAFVLMTFPRARQLGASLLAHPGSLPRFRTDHTGADAVPAGPPPA